MCTDLKVPPQVFIKYLFQCISNKTELHARNLCNKKATQNFGLIQIKVRSLGALCLLENSVMQIGRHRLAVFLQDLLEMDTVAEIRVAP